MRTFVIGHKKPDLDSVVSPMALAYLYQQEGCFGYKKPQAALADPINPETTFIFNKLKAKAPPLISTLNFSPKDQFILADHNEPSQRADEIPQDQIVEIVDHHKPNIDLNRPVFITIKVWGSTTTIAWWLMRICDVTPSQQLTQLMVAGILSDTLGLRSPTTTDVDKEALQQLAKIGEISDTEALTLEIFKAKSDLDKLTPEEKVTNDYKIYDFGGEKLLLNQIETVEQDQVLAEKDNLHNALLKVKEKEAVDYIYLIITDVLQANSKLLYTDNKEKQLAQKAFATATQVEENVLDLGPRLSRKKEIAPNFEKVLR